MSRTVNLIYFICRLKLDHQHNKFLELDFKDQLMIKFMG